MDLLEGETLQERIAGRPLKIEEFGELAIDTVPAKGIVHRDIKPLRLGALPSWEFH